MASDGSRGPIDPPDSATRGLGAQRPPDPQPRGASSCERTARGAPAPGAVLELGTAVNSRRLQSSPKLLREEAVKSGRHMAPQNPRVPWPGAYPWELLTALGATRQRKKFQEVVGTIILLLGWLLGRGQPPHVAGRPTLASWGGDREKVRETLARPSAWPGSLEGHQRFPGSWADLEN